MEHWRSQEDKSSTASDNFMTNIWNLPQIYPSSSSSFNQISTQTLQTPHVLHNPQFSDHLQTDDVYCNVKSNSATQRNMTLEETMASLAAGQSLIVESMARLMTRLENTSPVQQAVNDLTTGIGNINLDRNPPPQQQFPIQSRIGNLDGPPHLQGRASYAPAPPPNLKLDSPSEGAYARDPTRGGLVLREPRIRDNPRFTGESKFLRQFLLDIYNTLEQFSNSFSSNKRKINWIAAHFTTTSSDVSPLQSWFLSLLMKNAHIHGIMDPYANLKSLEYVIPPLLSADAFI